MQVSIFSHPRHESALVAWVGNGQALKPSDLVTLIDYGVCQKQGIISGDAYVGFDHQHSSREPHHGGGGS